MALGGVSTKVLHKRKGDQRPEVVSWYTIGLFSIRLLHMRKVEVVVMLIGSVFGILIRLSWSAPIAYFKLLIVGLGILSTLLMYVQAKAIKSAFPSMQRNDWSLAYVLRDAAKEGVLPKNEMLVSVAKVMSLGFALAFGGLIGLGVIEMLRTAG